MIRRMDTGAAEDVAARRKIGTRHDMAKLVDRDLGIFQIGNGRVADLAEIVRWNIRRHADGDTARTVDE